MGWLDIAIERSSNMGRGPLAALPDLAGALLLVVLFLIAARVLRSVIERLGPRHISAGQPPGRASGPDA